MIKLRELERGDLATLNGWRNDREVMELLGNNFLFIAGAVDERWYESYLASRERNVRLAITVGETAHYVGNVNLTGIHPINRSGELSILIGDRSFWGRGIGSEATSRMLEHAFRDLNLHRVHLTVLASNERARRLYRGRGFREEGVHREALFKNGTYVDVVSMARLRSDAADPA
jgi:diamine N-acetyltransferase